MSLIQFPTFNLASIAPLGHANETAAPSTDHPTDWDVIGGALRGAVSGMITGGPSGATAGALVGGAVPEVGWTAGRIVAIILGFILIAGGIIALTVSKETVINVAKTAAKGAAVAA